VLSAFLVIAPPIAELRKDYIGAGELERRLPMAASRRIQALAAGGRRQRLGSAVAGPPGRYRQASPAPTSPPGFGLNNNPCGTLPDSLMTALEPVTAILTSAGEPTVSVAAGALTNFSAAGFGAVWFCAAGVLLLPQEETATETLNAVRTAAHFIRYIFPPRPDEVLG
jgi:hypothetical protein